MSKTGRTEGNSQILLAFGSCCGLESPRSGPGGGSQGRGLAVKCFCFTQQYGYPPIVKIFAILLFLTASMSAPWCAEVRLGNEVLAQSSFAALAGKRIGLI